MNLGALFHVRTLDTLEEPPDKPFFRGVGKKKISRSIKYHFTREEESCFRIPVTRQASERP